jgi:hypothetical protein
MLALKAKTWQCSDAEFFIAHAILISAAESAQRGCDLFTLKNSAREEEICTVPCAESHFEMYAVLRVEGILTLLPGSFCRL